MPSVPTTPGQASSRKGAEGVVVVSSLVVLTFWGYRKLVEPGVAETAKSEPALAKIIGLEPKPASAPQFAVAFGFTFFTLSLGAMAAPELASAMAILIAVGYVLANGQSVFADIQSQLGEKHQFAGVEGAVTAGTTGGTGRSSGGHAPSDPRLRNLPGSANVTVAPNLAGLRGSYNPPTHYTRGSLKP